MRKSKIDSLRQQHEAIRLQTDIKRMQRVLAKYDAVEPTKMRRNPVRETTDEGQIYNITKRLLGCNLGRDLVRNYSPAKSMMHQCRVNVVGSLGKLRINLDGKEGDEATGWFNEVWSKDCDFRDDVDFSTQLQNILEGVLRDGDVLGVIDDGLVEDSGKMLTWESDQIAPVEDEAIKTAPDFVRAAGKITQDGGILRDQMGRIIGYACTGKRGIPVLTKDDATFWSRENARLIRAPYRLNQGRGIPNLLTSAANFVDLYEILSSELQSAKRTAKQYAFVKREDSVTDYDDPTAGPEFLPENDGRTKADAAADGANQTTHTARNYERLESFTGGLTDYLQPKDTVEFPKLDHPNVNLTAFLETVHGLSGASLGLARAYTLLRADSSYTAFRGDMIMTWVTFYWLQKWLERSAADWIARRVLTWAQRKKQVPVMPAGWDRKLSWTWPTMPEVNELDAQNAIAAALKNGTTDYAELLGPDWRKRLAGLADQVNEIRKLLLPLKVLETASGGMSGAMADGKNEPKRKDSEQ